MPLRRAILPVLLLLAAPALAAPMGWRKDGSGRFPEATPPLHWSPTLNVVWSTPMPAVGNASPVLTADRVFVTAEPTTLVCLKRATGEILWTHAVTYFDTLPPGEQAKAKQQAAAAEQLGKQIEAMQTEADTLRRNVRKKGSTPEQKARLQELSDKLTTMKADYDKTAFLRPPEDIPVAGNASATPLTDGKNVYAIFGNFVVASFTVEGKLRWARYLPVADRTMRGNTSGQAAAPLLSGSTLLIPLGHMQALNANTGKTLWVGERYQDYGNATLVHFGRDDAVMTADGIVTRVSDGKTLLNPAVALLYVSPMVQDGVAYFIGNKDRGKPDEARALAFKLPARLSSPFTWEPLWQMPMKSERQYSSPLIHEGRAFSLTEHGLLTIIDVAHGEVEEQRQLDFGHETVFPSPTLAGGYIYLSNSEGKTIVLEAKPPFRQVAENLLEPFRSSPVFAGRQVFIRTQQRMYCLEEGAHGH